MLRYDAGTGAWKDWVVEEPAFDARYLGKCESVFSLGNGYMGIRSATEENYVGETRGTFINGVFNRFDATEVSELVNLPDCTQIGLFVNGLRFCLESGSMHSYARSLNLKTGELTRDVVWESPAGDRLHLRFQRVVSLARKHVLAQRITITPQSGDLELRVVSGIDGRLSNSGSQHFSEGEKRLIDGAYLQMVQHTTQSDVIVSVNAAHTFSEAGRTLPVSPPPFLKRRYIGCAASFHLRRDVPFVVEKISSYATSRDRAFRTASGKTPQAVGLEMLKAALSLGYGALARESAQAWQGFWSENDVGIVCERHADQLALRFALYHLHILYDGDDRLGIGAKGLSGEGYKGHSFWDTELFVFPFFLMTQPDSARSLLEYRGRCAVPAAEKARANGYQGFMFPWESAWADDGEVTPSHGLVDVRTGRETPILTARFEQHITADIAYAVERYFLATGDRAFMEQTGYLLLLGTAAFWASRAEWVPEHGRYEIRDVIGPDEYKEHVDNNAYTNYMVAYNLRTALRVQKKLQDAAPALYTRLAQRCGSAALHKAVEVLEKLDLPQPDEKHHVLPQDDTYLTLPEIDLEPYRNAQEVCSIYQDYNAEQVSGIQVTKQADVILLFVLLPERFDSRTQLESFRYYERHTLHDSSLSASMHSIAASRLALKDAAYRFFQKAAAVDLGPLPRTSEEGIHAAAMGGIWQAAVFGFGGLSFSERGLSVEPHLPDSWKSLRFQIQWQGTTLRFQIEPTLLSVKNTGKCETIFTAGGREQRIPPNEGCTISLKGPGAQSL